MADILFLSSGHETTGTTLAMIVWYLSVYPDEQHKLYTALTELSSPPTFDELLKCNELNNVVNEVPVVGQFLKFTVMC